MRISVVTMKNVVFHIFMHILLDFHPHMNMDFVTESVFLLFSW